MIKNKILFFGFLLTFLFYMQPLAAQDEFVNEEIKVGHHQPVDIVFDKEIVSITFSPTGIYNIDDQAAKRITISCEKPNPGIPCTLTLKVGEGKKIKTHTFRIVYREEITDDEMLFDYSDPKKLKAAIKANHERPQTASQDKPAQESSPVVTEAPKTTSPAQKPPVTVASPPANSTAATTDYAGILNQAYTAYDNGNYSAALSLVQKALELRPEDRQAKSLKKDIDDKLNEKKNQDDKTRKENYYKAIGSAEVAVTNYDYDKAETFYKQALEYEDPGSTYVKSRLSAVETMKKTKEQDERRAKEQKEKDDNYRQARSLADMAFDKKDYEYAKQQYRAALTYKPQDSYANAQIIEIDSRILQDKKEQENRELQAKYTDARKTADDYFNSENYELARAAYNEALRYNAGDPYVTAKLKEIDKGIARKKQSDALKQRQASYTEAITIADAAFSAGDYEAALEKYNTAAKWMPGEAYPGKKITEIRALQKATAAKVEEERRQAEKQKKLDNDYTLVINRANDLFGKQSFSEAKQLYKQALALKPYEQYPQERITDIDNIIAGMAAAARARKDSIDAVAARKVKYNEAIARGKKALAAKDYPGAKDAYSEALLLTDTATLPQSQINMIDGILRDLAAREKARQDSIERDRIFNATYDSLMVIGGNAMTAENFDEAIATYRQAIDMKPNETNPKNLLKLTVDRKNDKLLKDSLAKEEQYYREYTQTKNDGVAAMKERRYADAKVLLAKALTMMRPNRFYGNDREYLINRINAIDATIARGDPGLPATSVAAGSSPKSPDTKTGSVSNQPVAPKTAPVTDVKISKNNPAVISPNLTKQSAPLPYSRQDLFSKYPHVNFHEPPPGQGFNVTEYYDTTENYRVSQMVMAEKPRMSITDKVDEIYLTCEGISFSGTNAFFKLKLSNNSKEDFLVGQMVLTWQKKDGSESKLYPGYVSSFPLLLPGREISIIYVAKSLPFLSDRDKLAFNLKDREKKIKLTLEIPADQYNGESSR